MTTWRHANEWHSDFTGLTHCMAPRGNGSPCECTTPTPDPASPCGALVATGGNAHVAEWQDCGRPADGIHHMPAHDYRATRCTCGHQLEAVNAR